MSNATRFKKWMSAGFVPALCALIVFNLTGCGKKDPSPGSSASRIALAVHESGDLGSAAALYKRALTHDPSNEDLVIGLGRVLVDDKSYDEAVHTFESALARHSKSVRARIGLGKTYLAMNRAEEACKYFAEANCIDPHDQGALNGLGISLDVQGKHKEAQEYYRSALILNPINVSSRNNLGLSLAMSGHYDEAINGLKRLSLRSDSTPRVRQNLALAYGLSGDFESASDILSLDLDKDAILQNLNYYRALRSMGKSRSRATAIMGGGFDRSRLKMNSADSKADVKIVGHNNEAAHSVAESAHTVSQAKTQPTVAAKQEKGVHQADEAHAKDAHHTDEAHAKDSRKEPHKVAANKRHSPRKAQHALDKKSHYSGVHVSKHAAQYSEPANAENQVKLEKRIADLEGRLGQKNVKDPHHADAHDAKHAAESHQVAAR